MNARILLIPDAVNGSDSGAHSARATVRYLSELGFSVAIYARDGDQPRHPDIGNHISIRTIPTSMRWYEFFVSPILLNSFREYLDDFRPNLVFFAGNVQKPAILAAEARRRGLTTVFLFYINDYFCPRIYAGTEKGPCLDCITSPILSCYRNGCFSLSETPHLFKAQLVRWRLGLEIKYGSRILGYGAEQLAILKKFGVGEKDLYEIGFQFDPSELSNIQTSDGGYFAITGQPIMQKGWHLLSSIFDNLQTSAKFKASIRSVDAAMKAVKKFRLDRAIESGRLELVIGLDDRADYLRFIAGARAIVLPSYYPSTGEFVFQESMYLGKPVHVFDVGVHRDVLTNKGNALVSPIGDICHYATNIDLIESDTKLRASVSRQARQSAEGFYSKERRTLLGDALA